MLWAAKLKFKNFNRDPRSIVSYGLKVENKHSLKSEIKGQILEKSCAGIGIHDTKITFTVGACILNCCFPPQFFQNILDIALLWTTYPM